MPVIPVILSGGSGTRLWPLSRASRPKQFLSFSGGKTLFETTLERCAGPVFDPRPILVGSNEHRFLLAEAVRHLPSGADIMLEEVARNSTAAVAAGAIHAFERDPESIILVLAADHQIEDIGAFSTAVAAAVTLAEAGKLVTFGIKPTSPATGYGYICPGEPLATGYAVKQFVEKPDAATAQSYIDAGYFWNSGNFLFKAKLFLNELKNLAPEILGAVQKAHDLAKSDLDFIRLDRQAYETAPSVSVDYAVMEKTANAAVFPVDYAWSDVGSWASIWQILPKDKAENAIIGDGMVVNGKRNLIHSPKTMTALIGIDNAVVVTMRDVVLVAGRDQAEQVKALVDQLKADGREQAIEALEMFRPWGSYERVEVGSNFQVKRIVVNPGGVLSLQKHKHRSEHWVVVAGEAEVTIDGTVQVLRREQSIYIPLGATHRLANRGSDDVVLIEVQTGDYLGEDDIIRLEDVYGRG
jgi:mannose-1-phosphate guanylyltransferase/mannose-6-phosphate isomerase